MEVLIMLLMAYLQKYVSSNAKDVNVKVFNMIRVRKLAFPTSRGRWKNLTDLLSFLISCPSGLLINYSG